MTARRLMIKGGRINDRQMLRVDGQFAVIAGLEPSPVQRFDQSPSGWVRTGEETQFMGRGGAEQR